jgi:hypothetical protein
MVTIPPPYEPASEDREQEPRHKNAAHLICLAVIYHEMAFYSHKGWIVISCPLKNADKLFGVDGVIHVLTASQSLLRNKVIYDDDVFGADEITTERLRLAFSSWDSNEWGERASDWECVRVGVNKSAEGF